MTAAPPKGSEQMNYRQSQIKSCLNDGNDANKFYALKVWSDNTSTKTLNITSAELKAILAILADD
jgi:hypothetical protein